MLLSIVLTPTFYMSSFAYSGSQLARTMHGLVIFLLVLTFILGLGDIVYSFYIASQMYGQFDEFQQGQVNCSSPVYYSSFVSVFLYVFVELGTALLLYILLSLLIYGK